jgi:alpha-mannosidase
MPALFPCFKARFCRVGVVVAAMITLGLVLLPSAGNAQRNPDAKDPQNARSREFNNPGPTQIAAAMKKLSSQSQTVIARLSKLGELSIEGWRYHVGDVQGGEGLTLDDSSWQQTESQSPIQTTDVVWLRKKIEIPSALDGYDLTGARLWIRNMSGNSSVSVFFNGERVAAGDSMEPLVLTSSAKPGETILVAIRIATTARPKNITSLRIPVGVDFAPNRPNPQDIYSEFVMAALLLPDLSDNASADLATLDKVVQDVDISALDANDQQKFDDSLRKAQQDLEPFRPTLQKANFHLAGNSHIDAAWLWPWTETVDVVRRTFGTALQLMDEYPDYTYSQSGLVYNEWMAEKYPEINAEIKKRIQEGRWEIVGGMWVEPDLNLPGGESQVRQLLVGQREAEKLYGVTARIGWNPDTFGYDWQLPQIYKKSGVDYFVTQKLSYNETNPFPFKIFWWQSPDGSRVLTYLPHDYGNSNLNPVRLTNDVVHARPLNPGFIDLLDLYGVGDHGGGPTRAVLDQGLHWMKSPDLVVPRMEFGTAQSYFTEVEKTIAPDSPTYNYQAMAHGGGALPTPPAGKISIPVWNDEIYFEHHRGTYTTQAQLKRNVRESEEWLLNAEKYSSIAWLNGNSYPGDELTESWKKALFNQFHDLAAGSGIGISYKDAQRDYDQVRWQTNEASSKALNDIQARIDTHAAGAVPILVFNPLSWERSGLAEVTVEMPAASDGISILDAKNHVLPSQILSSDSATNTYHVLVDVKDVPSVGYTVLHAVPGRKPFASDLKVNGLTMENSFLKVTVDPSNGCITSLYDKKDNFESLASGACGNQLQTFHDHSWVETAWNIDPGTFDHVTPITEVDSVKLVEQTPLRAVIRVARTWQSSKFVQDITLYADSDNVDVVNNVEWHETYVLLKAAFPLAASSKMATYEIPYGTIERPTTRDNDWDAAKFEVSAIRWADLGDGQHGFSLINEAKYGYDCKDNVLRLTLLRSPTDPDPNADRGHQHFSYALYPHAGDWRAAYTVRHGYEYNYPLHALQVDSHTGAMPLEHSFFSVSGDDSVILTAVKKAEDTNALILRFYEWAGKDGQVSLTFPQGATSATLTNLMEKPEGSPLDLVNSDSVTVPVGHYSINTLEVAYPHEQQ